MKANTAIEVGRIVVSSSKDNISGEADLQFEWIPTNWRTSPKVLIKRLSEYICGIPGIITSETETPNKRTIDQKQVKSQAKEWLDDYLGKSNWKWHSMWTTYAVL